MQHVSYVHICPHEKFMSVDKINDLCNTKMKVTVNYTMYTQHLKVCKDAPDKHKALDRSVE